jgi:hypothetical protein
MGITRAQIARQLLAKGGKIGNTTFQLARKRPDGKKPGYFGPDAGEGGMESNFGQDTYSTSDVDFGGVSGGTDQQFADTRAAIEARTPKETLGQKIVNQLKNISKFSPSLNIFKGIGNLFDKFQNLRGFNPDGTRRTQAQFEQARRDRINQNRISNILGRDAPFTLQTLENLAKLGYTGPLDKSLIGSTNITRSGTSDQNFPDRVEGIVSQAPEEYRFTDAMANLNLQRGVPRDQVFSTRTATGNNFNILDFAVPGHSKAMYEGKDSIVSNAPSVKDYHIAANADLSRRISDQLKNIPGVGEAASLGYDVVAPALSYPVSIGYDALQAKQRMEPGSGIKGFYDAFMNESPFSAAAYRAAGVSAPLAERIQGT